MKKSIVTLLIIFISFTQSFAQVNFGVKGGLNFSNVKNIGTDDYLTKTSFHLGLFSELPLSKSFIVNPELLYSVKGYAFPATPYTDAGSMSYNYISIPVLLGYKVSKKFMIKVGPEFNFLTDAVAKFGNEKTNVSNHFNKFDMAVDLGVAYALKHGLGIEARYSYGFDDLFNGVQTDVNGNIIQSGSMGSNRVFQLGLFYRFSN